MRYSSSDHSTVSVAISHFPAAQPRELLGLGELGLVGHQALLGLVAAGEVEDLADVVERLAARVAHERRAHERDRDPAVGPAQPRLRLEAAALAVLQPLAAPVRQCGLLVGDDLEDRAVQQVLHGPAEQPAERRVGAPEAAVRGHERHAQGRVGERLDEPLGVGVLAAGQSRATEKSSCDSGSNVARLQPAVRASGPVRTRTRARSSGVASAQATARGRQPAAVRRMDEVDQRRPGARLGEEQARRIVRPERCRSCTRDVLGVLEQPLARAVPEIWGGPVATRRVSPGG